MPLDARPTTREPKSETFALRLNLDDAQFLFDLIGDLILEKQDREQALKIYKQFTNAGFIDQI